MNDETSNDPSRETRPPDSFNTPIEPVNQVAPPRQHRRCTGARLGSKKDKVIQLLAMGKSKLSIAKTLKISPSSVRAVARSLKESYPESYAAPSGDTSTAPTIPCSVGPQTDSDILRGKARLMLAGIDDEKIRKASLSALSLGADRLLNRATSIENSRTDLSVFAQIATEYGIVPSHSVSRLTVKQEISVESAHSSDTLRR